MNEEFIFVFGSNLLGKHGRGAAAVAVMRWGAKEGIAEGRTGNAYAIPTKRTPTSNKRQLPLEMIEESVKRFLKYAEDNPGLTFIVTRVGCGLAGYFDTEIAPMFRNHGPNVCLSDSWKLLLSEKG